MSETLFTNCSIITFCSKQYVFVLFFEMEPCMLFCSIKDLKKNNNDFENQNFHKTNFYILLSE